MIKIVEIISRSEQGITRPFICRGDNGKQYFVKGAGAGRRALIAEWIAGHLGMKLGLPIPPFDLAEIPAELIRFSARDDVSQLGSGVAFASQKVDNVDELSYLLIPQVGPQLRAKILLFDWWTRNGDRTLTADGGNPNLLWMHRDQKLFVIDHNLAFDGADMAGFWDEHIFAAEKSEWTPEFQAGSSKAMENAVKDLQIWWREMPEHWTEVETGITRDGLQRLLWQFQQSPDIFWRRR